jgi:putative membrane protein
MKSLLRAFLINLSALWLTAKLLPGLQYSGGLKALIIGAVGLMAMNVLVIPLLKVMFLPLNLLTLGIFAWLVNVVALYLLTNFLPFFRLIPYDFNGANLNGFIIPAVSMNVLQVAIVASFMIGFISHFLNWLIRK